MTNGQQPDGSLLSWKELESTAPWKVLLLGNGLSVNVWEPFGYPSLFGQVRDGGLGPADAALFHETTNFERVLADVNTAIRIAETVGSDPTRFYEAYRCIQSALGDAIRRVHLNRVDVPDQILAAIRAELIRFEWIFTTSYDLLIYWAMGCSPDGRWAPFIDHFRWNGRNEFHPAYADVAAGQTPVYFLHGALHLVVHGTGVNRKLTRNAQTLLDQFGQPLADDPQARPLLVTEGSSRDKLRIIEGNDYLSHSLETLRETDLPVVVFGSSLSKEDEHLVSALSTFPDRPVAISMYPASTESLLVKQADIWERLRASNVVFFDSTTHPLGSPGLRVSGRGPSR